MGDKYFEMKNIKRELYRLTDSFLVEGKDQNGKERSLERLNQDRHLFVENVIELMKSCNCDLKELNE